MKRIIFNLAFWAVFLAGLAFAFRNSLRAWLQAAEASRPARQSAAADTPRPGARKILYYRDAMNPSHRSDKPGTDSMGMPLVPVYADEAQATSGMSPGTVKITPQKQQLIGVETAKVE